MKTITSETDAVAWRFARLARRRRLLTMAALEGKLTTDEADFLKPTGFKRLRDKFTQAGTAVAAAVSLLAVTGNEALAGGSGLQIETALQPWWIFLTNVVPWWASTVAIVLGAIVLMFAGFGQGGSRMVSALSGAIIAVGVITWVMGGLGASQAGLLN